MKREQFVAALGALDEIAGGAFAGERRYVVAERRIRVRFSSRRLAEGALRALAHLVVEPRRDAASAGTERELTVFVLDHDAPGNPLAGGAGGSAGRVAARSGAAEERVERFSYDGPEGRGLLHEGFRALFLLDRAGERAAFWVGEPGRIPYYLASSPLLPILSWYLADRGRAVVHAGAVATETGAVLLAGKSGTGKSTAALACLAAGLDLLGDDMCVIEPAAAIVHSLYCSAKVEAEDVGKHPALAAALAAEFRFTSEKALFLFDRHRAGAMRRSAPVAAVAIPVRGSVAPPQRLSAREAFLAIAPNTIFQLPGIGRNAAAGVKSLVTSVPVFRVGTGHSIDDIAPRLRDFATSLAVARRSAGAG